LHPPPGKYHVLVEYLNLGSIDDDGIEGSDRYVITLEKSDG
jgi:hypothetical protein